MLFNGEEVGDGTGPECDVAVDPIDGTTLTAKGMSNAIAVLAVVAARHRCTTRRPCSTWRSSSPAPRPPTSSTSATRRREHPRGRQGQGHARRTTSPSSCSTGRGTQELVERDPRHRCPDQVHHRRRRRRRDHGRPARHRRRPAARHRRHAGGHHRGLRDEVHGRRDPGPALARGRRRAAEGARRRSRPRPRLLLTTDDLVTGDDCFFVATGITDGELMQRRALPGRRRDHRLAGDALAQRHDPLDQSEHRFEKLRAFSAIDFEH